MRRFLKRAQQGAIQLEYVILAGVLGLGGILWWTGLGQQLWDKLIDIGNSVAGLPTGGG